MRLLYERHPIHQGGSDENRTEDRPHADADHETPRAPNLEHASNLAMDDRGSRTGGNPPKAWGTMAMNDSYGSMMREVMKKSMSKAAGTYRPAKLIPTWWDRNGNFVGVVCWVIVILAVFTELLWMWVKSLPR
jgi:hypothetical protein